MTRRSSAVQTLLDRPPEERRIGPFLLIEQLGRGGFAPVWLARETYGTREVRRAAVKLFALDRERTAKHDAIVEEAGALCRVEHPNVVRFYQLALDEASGVAGLAMEYVHGTALDRRLEAGPLGVDEALAMGIAVGSALAAVHAAGLVHRDVKPANVVEASGVHKLIDFGIAAADTRTAAQRAPRRIVLDDLPLEILGTKMSMLVDGATPGSEVDSAPPILSSGTVGYMDPAVVGAGATPAPASDLYGLGALLFEALSGKLPAVAAAPRGTGLSGEVLDGRAAPPSIRTLVPEVPAELADLVDALLSPRREGRPETANEVVTRLRAVAARRAASPGAPASTRSSPPREPGGAIAKSPSRGRGVLFAALTVAGLSALGVGSFLALRTPSAPGPPAPSTAGAVGAASAEASAPAPGPTPAAAPVTNVTLSCVESARASSAYPKFPASYAFDDDPATAWNENVPGDGTGEWVEARLRPGTFVDHVEVGGGWSGTADNGKTDLWTLNNSFRTMRVSWDGGSTDVEFDRKTDRGVRKRVAIGAATYFVRFTAIAVDRGKVDDLCLDDALIFGSCPLECAGEPSDCADDLFVQLAVPSPSSAGDYGYPGAYDMMRGHPELEGTRAVEARRGGKRVMGAIVKNRCAAMKVTALAQKHLTTSATTVCEKLDVIRDVWTVPAGGLMRTGAN